jgi:hypothetical protein
LAADTDIVIKPADKNLGLVILDKSWYIGECNRQLADTGTYRLVSEEETTTVLSTLQQELSDILEQLSWRLNDSQVLEYLRASLATHTTLPSLYLLPKIHKLPVVSVENLHQLKGRPIVASTAWVTTPASAWLADILNTTCFKRFPQVLPDSRTLIVDLESTLVARDSLLVSFDVESMYPNVDVNLAVTACMQIMPPHLRPLVRVLLSWVMHGNYFQFEGKVYHQIQGGAMGTPCMPPVANIHMAYWVEDPLRSSAVYWPRLYRRFIDDGFMVWEQDRASLMTFLDSLNAALPTIKLTWEVADTSIAFMDLIISKDLSDPSATMVPLSVSTFQKPHNLYLYIPRASFHKPHVFKGFVHGELLRYAVTNTTVEGFEHMKHLFLQRLIDRGYPKVWLATVFASVLHEHRHLHLQRTRERHQRAPRQPVAPVFVAEDGAIEASHSLSKVVNEVYARHAHCQELCAVMCDASRVTVTHRKCPSLASHLVRARL